MPKEDKLGPRENQSPRYKRGDSIEGVNPKIPHDELYDAQIGGNKHTSTGGGTDEFVGSNECIRGARENYGIDSPEPPLDKDFDEGSDYNDRSQGSTLDRGSIK